MKSLPKSRPALSRACRSAAWVLATPLLIAPAYAQTGQTASLLEALSLVSGRMLVAPPLSPQVSQDGDRFHVHIPLPKLTTPPDAAIEVTATPLSSGIWDITTLTFPQAGTVVAPPPNGAPNGAPAGAPDATPVSLRYTIGQQTAHARIDPTLAVPSPYAMALSDIALYIESALPPANLTIRQIALDGTLTGDANQRMTTRSRGRADDWHLTAVSQTGTPLAVTLKSAEMRYDVDGLDRAQAERLREAARMPAPGEPAIPGVDGQPPAMSPAVREKLHAIVEATAGLMSGFDIEDTLRGLHFAAAGGQTGDIGEIRIAFAGESTDGHVAGHYGISLNEMALAAAVPAQFAQYAPRRFSVNAAFAGISAAEARQLMRQATEAGTDPEELQSQALALLNQPGARAGIEALLIEAGPLLLQGSARIRPTNDGSIAFDVHLSAHGLDEMLALVQSDPAAQPVMPMLFMAKGMGKPDGDDMIWDIAFADGAIMVNGAPIGAPRTQSGGQMPGVHRPAGPPPVNR